MKYKEWMLPALLALGGLAAALGVTTPQERLSKYEKKVDVLENIVSAVQIDQVEMKGDMKYLVLRIGELTGKPKRR